MESLLVCHNKRLMTTPVEAVYSAPGGVPLGYDLFRPAKDAACPLVVCIHGGGWISGERCDMHDVAANLARNGFAAACISYRLAPLHPFPAAVNDVQAFLTYINENADSLGIDSSRVATLGNSAGGHLAAMGGLTGPNPASAVVDICGISDVTDPRTQHYPVSWGFLEQFMQLPYEGNEEAFRQASPCHHVHQASPPFLLIHGEADDIVPVQQSKELARKLSEAGVKNYFVTLPNEGHGFSYEAWAKIERLYTEFLTTTLL